MVYHKSALASASARETDQQHTHLGDDPHPERRFTPASKGQGRSAGDDHRSQQPKASSDRNRGNAIPGGGQASGADGHGNHTTDNVSWANWWAHKSTYGVDEILKMVRDRFNKSTEGGLKQYSNSEGLGAATQQLPRLPLYDSILHGPSVDRQLEYHILSELNYLLRLAQAHVKALGVEPFELKDVHTVPDTHMLPGQGPTVQGPAVLSLSEKALYHLIRLSPLKGYMSPLVDTSSTARSLKGYTTTPVDTSSCPRSVAQPVALLSKEEEKKQLVEVLHKLTAIVRRGLSLSVQSSHASPEFAARANMFMDCLDKNFEVVLLHKGHCFSLTGLIAKLAIPESVNTVTGEVAFYANALQKVLTVAECVVKNIGTCPGPFDKIGREAQKILNDDFPFGKLKLNTLGNDTAAFAFGAQGTPDEASELFMIKTKGKNQSVYFSAKPSGLAANVNGNAANVNGNPANGNVNAANGNGIVAVQNDAYFTKLSMDKLYGENIKCVLKLPFPSLNVKVIAALHIFLICFIYSMYDTIGSAFHEHYFLLFMS